MISRAKLLKYAKDKYNTSSEHLWSKFPDYEVLRHKVNRKWYAVIMNVKKKLVGLENDEYVDILNVKCDPGMIGLLTKQKGYAPAYHMNKEHWISIILDGSVQDNEIFDWLDNSYSLTK